MAVALGRRLLSIEEFERDYFDSRYELINGELKAMAPTGEQHGRSVNGISTELSHFIKKHKLGGCFGAETGFVVQTNPDSLLAPDWAYVKTNRLPFESSPKFSQIVPDAVLEVRSPSDRTRNVQAKMEQWVEAGVGIAWEYDPSTKTMTVYRPGTQTVEIGLDGIVSGEDVIPGFEMSLQEMLE